MVYTVTGIEESPEQLQGVPYHWAHFVFAIFSGSRAYTEELFIAIG